MNGEQTAGGEWLPGFERRLEGEIIPYESAQRGADSALLVRSLEERHSIAWETAPVPVDLAGDVVRFVWLFGFDANPEQHEFSLRVDGEQWLRFSNPAALEPMEWVVEGREVSARRISSRADGTRWELWVEDVPAFGYRTFRVEAAQVAPTFDPPTGGVLENEHYRVELDPASGALRSLFDKELGRELVDADAPWGMGQLVYETLGNRHQLEGFRLDDYERQAPTGVALSAPTSGPIWQELTARALLPCSPDGVSWQVRLYHREKRVELHYAIDLRRSFEPEGLYVALPFDLPQARVAYETLGGIAEVGADILPGAASDWQAVQSFTAVRGPAGQVVLTSEDIPLVQLGEINLGKFQRQAQVDLPHVYSWVFNNYWTTNFRASQEGELRWSYALTSGPDSSNTAASRFGWSARIPLVARALPAGGERTPTTGVSLLELGAENLILVAARPARDGEGVVLHLREVEGRQTRAEIRSPRGELELRRVDVLENDRGVVDGALEVGAFETVFLRASW